MPIYFYLEPEIGEDLALKKTETIRIIYRFYKSKNQDLAKLVEGELKHVRKNKMILQKMRELKSRGNLSNEEL